MPGLLERAERIVAAAGRIRRTGTEPPAAPPEESGVSPDERRELLAEIDRLFTERHHIDSFGTTKGRRGLALPLSVNLVAAGLLILSIFTIARIAGLSSERRASETADYVTTEGLVVKAVKQQAAKELSDREARIAEINRQLESLRGAAGNVAGSAAAARQKQLESELAALQSEATTRLSALTLRRQQQEFLARQLQAIYQNIRTDIAEGNISRAIDGIASADSLLQMNAAAPDDELAAIAPALAAGNIALRDALLFGRTALSSAQSSELPAKITEIDRLVRHGDERYEAHDYEQAGLLYTKAVTTLESVARAYNRLLAMSKETHDREMGLAVADADRLKDSIRALEATIAAQRTSLSEEQATSARQRSAIAEQRVALQRRTEELAAVVGTVQRSLAQAAPAPASGEEQGREVVDLLKTKVAIRELADAPQARKSHPELYDKLNTFFSRYAEVYDTHGRQAALEAIASALDEVILSLNLRFPADPAMPSSAPAG